MFAPQTEPAPVLADVLLFRLDDWEVLYVNGRLAKQGHHVRPSEMMECLMGKTIHSFVDECVDASDAPVYSFDAPLECRYVSEFYALMDLQKQEEAARDALYAEEHDER